MASPQMSQPRVEAFKFGFNPQGLQRYRCKYCGKTFSDIPRRPLDDLRVAPEKAFQVVNLLAEGVGIRACERLTQLNRHTVLAILETAGQKCGRLLDAKVRGLKVEQVEIDELWAFVGCKQANVVHPLYDDNRGDQYTYLAVDRDSKLMISHLIGKRHKDNCKIFLQDLKDRVDGRFQLSSDGFNAYIGGEGSTGAVERIFGDEIDYGTEVKIFGRNREVDGLRKYSPPECIAVRRRARIGNPKRNMICTSHAERANLSVRLFNRRFTRLTLGYSKKLANHKHAVALFVAHFNYCRKHSARGQTPAMAAGLTDHVWSVRELLGAL
jgi:transposase-like protein/IS1 family transposase